VHNVEEQAGVVGEQGPHKLFRWAIRAVGLTYLSTTPNANHELMTTLHRNVKVAEAPSWLGEIEIAWPSTRATCARVVVNCNAVPSTSQVWPAHALLFVNQSVAVNGDDPKHDGPSVAAPANRPDANDGTVGRGALIETTGPLTTRYHFCDAVLMGSPGCTMAVTTPDRGQVVITRSTVWTSATCTVQHANAQRAVVLYLCSLHLAWSPCCRRVGWEWGGWQRARVR
jgi:hypothetical protein